MRDLIGNFLGGLSSFGNSPFMVYRLPKEAVAMFARWMTVAFVLLAIAFTAAQGATWTTVRRAGWETNFQDVCFVDSSRGWAIGQRGFIIRTTDGGTTWTQQESGTDRTLRDVDFLDEDHGWAVGADGLILHTTDGGEHWSPQSSGTIRWLQQAYFVDSTTGWVVGDGGTILYTENGGATWTTQASGTADNLTGVYFISLSEGWIVGDHGVILHTTDGANWSSQDSPISWWLRRVHFVNASQGWASGWWGTILHTTDGGETWSRQSSGVPNDVLSIYFTDSQNGWCVGNSGLILHTTDGGATWVSQVALLSDQLSKLFFLDERRGWGVGVFGHIIHTEDGGITWSSQNSGTLWWLRDIFFINEMEGWTVGDGSVIRHTTNGGSTWSYQSSDQSPWLIALQFVDANEGWIVGHEGTILHTVDKGDHWIPQTSGTDRWLEDVYFVDIERGWTVGQWGTVIHTMDGGATWLPQNSGTEAGLKGMYFVDAEQGWLVGDWGTILHTEDGGANWTPQTSNTSYMLTDVCFADTNEGWAVGDGGTILHTVDSGNTWEAQSSGVESLLRGVYYRDGVVWTTGDWGRILKYVSVSIPSVAVSLPDTSVDPGDTLSVPVVIGDVTGLEVVSAEMSISYDSNVVTALEATTSGTLAEGWTDTSHVVEGIGTSVDTLKIAMATAEDTLVGAGNLVFIRFAVSASAAPGDSSALSFEEFVFNEGDPAVVTQDGLVSIRAHFGDVSGNGRVMAFDAALILQETVGIIMLPDPRWPAFTFEAANVSGDTTISAYDASLVLQYVVGLIKRFPVEEGGLPKWASFSRRVSLGSAEALSDGSFVLPVLIDEMDGVVAGELTLSFDLSAVAWQQADGNMGHVEVRTSNLTSGYLLASNVQDGRIKVAFAGVEPGVGSGTMLEVALGESSAGLLSSLRLEQVSLNEGRIPVRIEGVESETPKAYRLSQNYPNPFNAATQVSFSVPMSSRVKIVIYNLLGQLVRELADRMYAPGGYQVRWDGTDRANRSVSSGVYVVRMITETGAIARTMMVLR